MIGKGSFGRNFSGLLKYIAEDVHERRALLEDAASAASPNRGLLRYMTHSGHKLGAVYYVNLAANTPEAAAREMAFIAKLSRRVEKPVFQLIISLHPDESKDAGSEEAKRLAEAAARVLAKLGLSGHQAAYAVHLEKKHLHCHVCVNRVAPNGKVWSMWRSAERIMSACRQVELEMGYSPYRGPQTRTTVQAITRSDIGPPTWTPKEIRRYEKTGVLPAKSAALRKADREAERERNSAEFRPFVSAPIKEATSWDDAISRLKVHGFTLELYCKSARRGLQVVRHDGKRVAASAIDSKFGLIKLERQWGRLDTRLVQEAGVATRSSESGGRRSSPPLELPEPIREPHRRLSEAYCREITPVLQQKNREISELRAAESGEVAAIRADAKEELRALRQQTISRGGRTFTKSRIVLDCRRAVHALREKYREKRQEINNKRPVTLWIDFLLKRAIDMVQDAITVLAWLRRHLDRRSESNRLVPSTGLHTPPEPFPHRDFTHSVADTGVMEYRDRLGQLAFVDRGDEIVIVTNDEGRAAWDTMGAALQHADMKWGGCFARGADVFRQVAFDVASDPVYRTKLQERYPTGPAVQNPRSTEKAQPGTPVVQISPPSIKSLRRYR